METLKNVKPLPTELQGLIAKSFSELQEKADYNSKKTIKFELHDDKKEQFQKRINELIINETKIRCEIDSEKNRHKSAMEDIMSRMTNTKNEMVAKVDCVENKYYNDEIEIARYSTEFFEVEFAEINGKPQIVDFWTSSGNTMHFTDLRDIFISEEEKNDENKGEKE